MSTLTGVGHLVRFKLRLDRVRIPIWIAAIGGVIIASAASLVPLYPDQQSIDSYVELATGNPALVALAGPGYGFDDPNIGVILVNEVQLWGGIAFAVMAIFLLNRHTRAEEDDERAEVIRSSVVGRHAPDAAAVAVVSAAILALAALCGVGFVALDYAVVGSVALAASMGMIGLVFVGVTAVAAQVASSGRGAIGYASGVLLAAFVLRAVGDASDNALRWASPIGWGQSVRAFAHERWWPLALCVLATAALLVLAFWLSTRRDLGSGLVTPRAGPATAPRWLTHPVGLAARLQRGSVVGWVIGIFLTGAVYGSIGDEVEKMLEDNPAYAELVAQLQGVDLTDAFYATAMTILATIAAGFSISSVLRLRTEEVAGRADAILAAPISRWRWAASHLTIAVAGTTLIIGSGGLGTGIAYAAVSNDASQILRMTGASLATVPAVLVLVGVTIVLLGFVPRAALAAWASLAVVFLVGFFGEILQLPRWTRWISPLYHVPAVPARDLRWPPIVALLAVATALIAAGMWGVRNRDIRVH